jgi:hypothetical protein
MTRFFQCALLFILSTTGCGKAPYPSGPGTLFVRQQICDLGDFKHNFFIPENNLKQQGFRSYRFYRDLNDPKTYLLVFESSNVEKSAAFLQSSNFFEACVGAGLGVPLLWAGVGEEEVPNGDLLLARYEVKDLQVWQNAQKKNLPEQLYRLPSDPQLVLAAQAVSPLSQARSAVLSPAAQQARKALGVLREDFWFGSFLEKGAF